MHTDLYINPHHPISDEDVWRVIAENFDEPHRTCKISRLMKNKDSCLQCPFIQSDKQHCNLAIIYLNGRK